MSEDGQAGAMKPRLAIVIPMYNEEAGAEQCIRRVLDVLPTLNVSAALIVVNDGSLDETGPLLDRLRKEIGSFEIVHKPNGGYGSAIAAGAREASRRGFEYTLFMDSDLTNPPEHIARFVPAISDSFDLIKGSRFSDGGEMDAVPWDRRIFSVAGNIITRILFRMGVADCTNGFRAIRTKVFLEMPLKERGFAVILEELYWAKRLGATVANVPTSLAQRAPYLQPTRFSYRPRLIWQYLWYSLRAGILRYRARPRAMR